MQTTAEIFILPPDMLCVFICALRIYLEFHFSVDVFLLLFI